MRIDLCCFCGGRLAGSYPDELGERAVGAWERQHVGKGHRWIDYPSWAARAETLTEASALTPRLDPNPPQTGA